MNDGHPCYGAGYTDGHDAGRTEGYEDGARDGYEAALTIIADYLEVMAERRAVWALRCVRVMWDARYPREWAEASAKYVREVRVLRHAARLIRRRSSERVLDQPNREAGGGE